MSDVNRKLQLRIDLALFEKTPVGKKPIVAASSEIPVYLMMRASRAEFLKACEELYTELLNHAMVGL